MPEGNGEYDVSDDASFKEIIEKEVGGSFPALLKFDAGRNQLYDRLAELATQVPELLQVGEREVIDIGEVNGSFEELIKNLHAQDGLSATFRDTVVDLVLSDSGERVSMMRAALDGDSMPDFKRDTLKELVSNLIEIASTSEEAIDNIVQMYDYDLNSDINNYLELLVHKNHNGLPESQAVPTTLEIKKDLKDHVTDVAKIVAGVTIALTVDRLLRRKN